MFRNILIVFLFYVVGSLLFASPTNILVLQEDYNNAKSLVKKGVAFVDNKIETFGSTSDSIKEDDFFNTDEPIKLDEDLKFDEDLIFEVEESK